MRAPVYRNIEATNTLLGLSFPAEVLAFLAGSVGCIQLFAPVVALLGIACLYGGIRFLGHGRPPLFMQHFLSRRLRKALTGNRLSAAARSSAPRFPHGRYLSRDVPRRGGGP